MAKMTPGQLELRQYQIDISDKATACLSAYGLVYLAMETRTGKTVTAFETIRKFGAKSVLFVTKKKAIKSIQSDYQHYSDLFACTVINYESVSKCHGEYDLIVCDEAHSLGAFPKPAKRVKDLLKITRWLPIIYLSATPTPESYSQLYHQFYISSFSPFKAYRNFYKWAYEFVDKKIKYLYNREINDYSHAKIDKIEEVTKHLFFTQTQVDSGIEQTITEKVLYAPMNSGQRLIIDKLIKDRVYIGQTGAAVLADTAVKMQSKVHQLCSGTVIDEDGNSHIICSNKAVKIAETFVGQKIAIFYKFQAEFELLKKVFVNWTTSPEEFQSHHDRTFLGQFQSSREGIRLDTADAIVFYNIDFSFLSYEQSKNRIVSTERTKSAVLYWVFSEGGIEEKIYRVVCKKKDYTLYYFKRDYHVRGSFSGKGDKGVEPAGVLLLAVDTNQQERHTGLADYEARRSAVLC